jgi:Zn-dependent protease/predicted transcriptional regulator
MPWSWKIGRVRGISIYVHATFLLIIGWAALAGWSTEQTAVAAAYEVIFILALFGCIVLHELGHALTALRFGIKTRDITLLPIGGVARLERMPKEPLQELTVALAGPAVNVVIAGLIAIGLWLAGAYHGFTLGAMLEGSMLERLMIVNIFLVLFNLLPAFPMDGGRALRALLATRMGSLRATQAAASVGQGMALIFGLLGLMANPFLVLIALFVWMGARQEAASAQAEALLGRIPVERAMIRDFHAVHEHDSLGRVVQLGLVTPQVDFPVLDDDGKMEGMLTREALLTGLGVQGGAGLVESAMEREFVAMKADDSLGDALMKFQSEQRRTLPVLREGRLEGLLTRDHLQAFMSMQSALSKAGHSTPKGVPPQLQKPEPVSKA